MFNRKPKPSQRRPLSSRPKRNPAFSYYKTEPQEIKNDSSKKSLANLRRLSIDRRQHMRNLPTYVSVLLIIGSILYATTLDTTPKILVGRTADKNSLVRSSSDYQSAIGAILKRSIFNHNKLTIDTDSVANAIESSFPEIEHATVTLPLLGRHPIIGLDPSEPALVLSSTKGSFIVGQDGRALISTDNSNSQTTNSLTKVEDQSGLVVEQGNAALPKDTVAFITTLINQLKNKNITVESMILPTIADELHVRINNQPYYIKFNLQGDARLQTGTLLAVMDKLKADNITPVAYIDVRLDERAYYK
ncbi:MAG TPA: hypothetical protein VLF39_00585 [Candidatus Saccharimonadales bacterium]|nr:hypothetical protein [Candidatus Saccharimonadales bacterium]